MAPVTKTNFTFLPLGAIVQEFLVDGQNIVQNFGTAEQYKKYNDPFFGETIGRVANRISDAKIDSLNGRSYQLAANNGPNTLHGGAQGWGKREFDGPKPVDRDGKEGVLFKYVSKDGDEGFPGTVELRVWYTAWTEDEAGKEKAVLEVEYEVEMVGDEAEETAVGITNHRYGLRSQFDRTSRTHTDVHRFSYFNLSGDPTIEGTEVTLSTNRHQVVDENDIPTGAIEPYPGIEPNKPFTLGAKEPDVDHCFIMNTDPSSVPLDTRKLPLKTLGTFHHPKSKIHLEISSTEPGFQFYTGKYIDVPAVDGLAPRGPRSGFAVEPSRYINAVNTDEWKGMVLLGQGQKFGSRILYRGWRD